MNTVVQAPAPATPAALSHRIAAIRADLTAAREKARRLQHAIATREKILNRLQPQAVLRGGTGSANNGHEQ